MSPIYDNMARKANAGNHRQLNKADRAALFVKLRAARYGLKEVADLLKIPLCDAYKLEREQRQEIETERDFLTFKNDLSQWQRK